MDFENAEMRGLSKTGSWSDSTTGTCGDPDNDNGYGIEYPAQGAYVPANLGTSLLTML